MTMTEADKVRYEEIKEDVLNGKDITKSDIVFLLKVITFLEIDNKNLSETLDRRDKYIIDAKTNEYQRS